MDKEIEGLTQIPGTQILVTVYFFKKYRFYIAIHSWNNLSAVQTFYWGYFSHGIEIRSISYAYI